MKVDIRSAIQPKITHVVFAEQVRIKSDSFDFDNATEVEFSNYGAKPNLELSSASILVGDWENFKKAGDLLIKENSKVK
jgi:hypothetical protein